ncbi:MAG: YHS domain-containing (seleno)protein [Pseudomonadota bacterium]
MITRRNLLIAAAAAPLAAAIAAPAHAAAPPVFSEGGAAIRGADAVAYFTEGRAVDGSPDFTAEHMGTTWRFVSAENRDLFMADPDAYAPQYGGYCAFAVSRGYTASIDPEAWTVHDGKLYLNFSKSVRRRWSRDIPGNIAAGDANWPAVLEA